MGGGLFTMVLHYHLVHRLEHHEVSEVGCWDSAVDLIPKEGSHMSCCLNSPNRSDIGDYMGESYRL